MVIVLVGVGVDVVGCVVGGGAGVVGGDVVSCVVVFVVVLWLL